jgi:hypothetical protein
MISQGMHSQEQPIFQFLCINVGAMKRNFVAKSFLIYSFCNQFGANPIEMEH